MSRSASSGLVKRGKVWHINKVIRGVPIRKSTGCEDRTEAERFLANLILFGDAPPVTDFASAAARYVTEYDSERAEHALKIIVPRIGNMPLDRIHWDSIQPYILSRQRDGVCNSTINREISVIRRILVLAARAWRDADGRPILPIAPPLFRSLAHEAREPRPITHMEQSLILRELPGYMQAMVLFALNTGARDQEVCRLKWEWRTADAVFTLPAKATKTKRSRLLILNSVARRVVDAQKGMDPVYVFTRSGERVRKLNERAWRNAQERAGLRGIRIHDLRHTFGMRLRAAGVGHEDRQDLLGHYHGSITTHYSRAEIEHLIDCAESILQHKSSSLAVVSA